ncbi:alpha/beta-hydrolase [Hypoxylon sp. NC1633]|nr:alpha/beta-hydrolase [Hypoxylon sp. NC1633]
MSVESSISPLVREKRSGTLHPSIQPSSQKPRWSWSRLAVVSLAILSGLWLLNHVRGTRMHSGFRDPESGHQELSKPPELWTEWSTITPSEKLIWQPCFGIYGSDLKCARLTVPMDYHRPLNESTDNPKVHIALVMKPGRYRTDDPSSYSESPLLLNPGGPGGSGANFAMVTGQNLHAVLGGSYDVIGFDPRGVGATTPKADCFVASDDPLGLDGRNVAYVNRLGWLTSGHDVGLVNSSNVALSKLNARAKALSKLCKRVDEAGGDNSIFRYASTPNVARDMLSIVQAWDEWRSVPSTSPARSIRKSQTTDELWTDTTTGSKDSTKGKLVYWGFSYGTILGATFASMFPDKVGRLILDGVVDADQYVDRLSKDAILDADETWETFFSYCAEAGPRCRFYELGDEPEDIKLRFSEVMERLEKEPIIVIPSDINVPVLVTAGDVKSIVFTSLFAPVLAFPSLAILLRAIADDRLDSLVAGPVPTLFCHKLKLPLWPDDAQPAVGCSDKRYKLNDDVPTLQKRFEEMASYSSFADIWMSIGANLVCNGWEIEAKEPPMRWGDHPVNKTNPIETSFPILFMSNNLDPVTPLHGALKMTQKFSKASLVVQKAEGHCTVACVSLCTINHIRAYIDKGVLPPEPRYDESEWTTCECGEKPWKSLQKAASLSNANEGTEDLFAGKTAEEARIMMAYSDLRDQFADFTALQHESQYRNPLRTARFTNPVPMSEEQPSCMEP